MTLIMGIDAGGTKTIGMILTTDKDILFEVQRGNGNAAVNFNEAATNVRQVISDCLASDYGSRCKLIVAGVAGIEAGDNKARLTTVLKEGIDVPIILVNDALLAFHSVFNGDEGVLTIAGTGSISVGAKEKNIKYAGGWGHLLGDFGSSYHVAIEACRDLAEDLESEVDVKPLSKQLMEHLGIQDGAGLKKFIYHATKREIAAISSFMNVQAIHGDRDAQMHFKKAGDELAKQTARLIRKLDFATLPFIACKGSLLEKNRYVFEAFQVSLLKMHPAAEIMISNVSPTIGAVTIAKNSLKG